MWNQMMNGPLIPNLILGFQVAKVLCICNYFEVSCDQNAQGCSYNFVFKFLKHEYLEMAYKKLIKCKYYYCFLS